MHDFYYQVLYTVKIAVQDIVLAMGITNVIHALNRQQNLLKTQAVKIKTGK